MAKCDTCGTQILFGGVKDGDYIFCRRACQKKGREQSQLLNTADEIPEDVLAEHVAEIHEGNCPRCGGPGPVDVQSSHTIWSIVAMTSWKCQPELCCAACGRKKKILALFSCAVWLVGHSVGPDRNARSNRAKLAGAVQPAGGGQTFACIGQAGAAETRRGSVAA